MRPNLHVDFIVSLALLTLPVCAQSANAAPQAQAPSPGDSTNGKTGHHHHLLSRLNLTEAQTTQIKQIKRGTSDKAERHRQILAVLRPDQRKLLEQLRRERKEKAQTTSTTN